MNRFALGRLLAAHTPADDAESDFVESMRALLELPGDPFVRSHFTPGHFTASAFVLSPDRAALLLIHHAKLDRWLQPGGHLERDDVDVFAAALREVGEEVGIGELDPIHAGTLFDVDIHDIPPLKGEPGHRHYDLRVLFRSRSMAFQPGREVKGARWVDLQDLAASGADESVLRAARKLRGR